MLISPPPGYHTLDEIFSRVGWDMFGSEWTGEESKPIAALPSDYWRLPDTISELSAWFQSSDWLCEDVDTYVEKKAIERYKDVAAAISHRCSLGEYLAFLSYTNGQLRGVDTKHTNSEAFRELIYQPKAANRQRLLFHVKAKMDNLQNLREKTTDTDATLPFEGITRREEGKRRTKERYNTFNILYHKYYPKGDGKISKKIAEKIAGDDDARDRNGKAPEWTSVVRRLNELRRERAKQN